MKKGIKILLLAMLTALVSMTVVFISGCKKSGSGSLEFTFELNGGTGVEDVEVEQGEEVELPIPVYEGYVFDGWYTNAEFTGDPVTKVVVDGSATYYAKWAKGYKVNFNLDGGSLSTTYVYLKEGANVYDGVQAYVPTKAGVQFGAWFNGDAELAKNLRMPAEELSLTAKYKVPYTVELWGQNLAQTDYEKIGENIIGYEYAGVTFTSEQTLTGFKEIAHANSVTTKTISETTSENLFKHYFDRESYTVRFDPNYPDGSKSEVVPETVVYGTPVIIPSDYTSEGYCLVGWSMSANGEIVYGSDFLAKNLYNKDGADFEASTFVPERNTTLYGVWKQGAVDMFGSNDYIYLFDKAGDEIYLSRGSVFFKGEYDAENQEFLFIGSDGKAKNPGKMLSDEMFIYIDANRQGTKTRFENGVGLIEKETVLVTDSNGISYFVEGEGGLNTESKGTYIIDKDGYYVATFTEGEKAGQTLTLFVSTYKEQPVFIVRNEAEYAMEELTMFGTYNGGVGSSTLYQIKLTGFGMAIMNQGMSSAVYYSTLEDGILTLKNTYGQVYLIARITEEMGSKGYAIYDEAFDKTYTTVAGGTLTLDGTYNATYTVNGTQFKGYYTTEQSIFGGTIVTLAKGNDTYKFLITSEKVDLGDGNTTTEYTVEEKHAKYAEYNYRNDENYWYAPMLVINNEVEGDAIVYGYTTAREYVEVSRGTYAETEKKDVYKYEAKTFANEDTLADVGTTPWDITTVTEFVFAIDTVTTSYKLYYWYSAVVGGEAQDFDVEYTSALGGKLTLVAGLAIYDEQGKFSIGAYETSGNMMRMAVGSGYLYFEFDAEAKTFLTLKHAPYMAYLLGTDGYARKDAGIAFNGKVVDGKDVATYSVMETVEGERTQVDYEGTAMQTADITAFGQAVWQFTSNDGTITFKYIPLQMNSGSNVIAVYNEEYNGDYEADDGYLTLDGYGFMASFASSDGTTYTGVYAIEKENVIVLVTETATLYFDLKADKSFTVRGLEYGEYVVMNNKMLTDYFVMLDGYGKASVYTKVRNTETGAYEPVYVDENGTYTQNGNVFTVTYQDDDDEIKLPGEFVWYVVSNQEMLVFVVEHVEAARTYVNDADWSVITLDKLGNATKYNEKGEKETGLYVLVTDELFYYQNSEGTDAGVYHYNVLTGVAKHVSELEARTYYTSELESLRFTQYGFAIFDGATRYYYDMDGNNVIIYRQDFSDANANKYGFVAEDFGVFSDDYVTYGGKTYYYNDGYAVDFTRVEATKAKYPVLVKEAQKEDEEDLYAPLEALAFAPSGAASFTNIKGSVVVAGESYTCYVTRKVHEDNSVEMYVQVGNYRFDITVSYTGLEGSTYEVTRMRLMQSMDSYAYMYYFYQYYMYYNMAIDNVFGTIYLSREFDEAGKEVAGGPFFTAEFGEMTNLVDANGDKLEFVDCEYTQDDNGMITVEIVGKDGYTYRLYIGKQANQQFQQYGYLIYALTRVHEFTTDDGYTVNVERALTTEVGGVYPGYPMFLTVKKNGVDLTADITILNDGYVEYVVRTREETTDGSQGKITATTYYKLVFEEETNTSIGGENEDTTTTIIAPYKSVTVTEIAATTMYTADEASFVDITADGIGLLSVNGTLYLASEMTFDETTQTYTVTVGGGKTFTVKLLADNQVEITEVVEDDSAKA